MPSTASTRLRIELQAIGENLNSWGDTRLNEALKRLEEATAKVLAVTIAGSNVTLTSSNYIEDEARSAVLVLGGTPGATRKVIIPLVQKGYWVVNNTNAAQTIGGSSGNAATIRQGKWGWVYCDGTNTQTYDPEFNDLKPPTAALELASQKISNVAAGTTSTDAATLANKIHQFAAPTSALPMNGQKITGIGAATSATDAASLANRLDQFAVPTANLNINSNKLTSVTAGTSSTDAATLANRLDQFAAPTSNLNINSNKLTSVTAGTSSTDAATLANRLDQFAAPNASVAFGSQKITGLAAGSASTDAVNVGQIPILIEPYATNAANSANDAAASALAAAASETAAGNSATNASNSATASDNSADDAAASAAAAAASAAAINIPAISGNAGKYVTNDGTNYLWSQLDWAASVDVASAATANIGTAASNRVRITGTTTITSFGTSTNKTRIVLFADALTLTYNATSLILPGSANVLTAAGDVAIFASDGSGNWRCLSYQAFATAPGGGAGSVKLLTTLTASSSATLDNTSVITSEYDLYMIQLENLLPATNAVNLYVRVTTNGGSSWDATNYVNVVGSETTSVVLANGNNAGLLSSVANTAATGISGIGYLHAANSTSMRKFFSGNFTHSGILAGMFSGAFTTTGSAVNGIRFLFSSGNIASGKVRIYGIKTS